MDTLTRVLVEKIEMLETENAGLRAFNEQARAQLDADTNAMAFGEELVRKMMEERDAARESAKRLSELALARPYLVQIHMTLKKASYRLDARNEELAADCRVWATRLQKILKETPK